MQTKDEIIHFITRIAHTNFDQCNLYQNTLKNPKKFKLHLDKSKEYSPIAFDPSISFQKLVKTLKFNYFIFTQHTIFFVK